MQSDNRRQIGSQSTVSVKVGALCVYDIRRQLANCSGNSPSFRPIEGDSSREIRRPDNMNRDSIPLDGLISAVEYRSNHMYFSVTSGRENVDDSDSNGFDSVR